MARSGRKPFAPGDRKGPLITTVRRTVRDKVERLADRAGVSISEIIRRAIEQYVGGRKGQEMR